MSESVRLDVWLWAVRIFRTRAAANAACAARGVRVDDVLAKPSRQINAGHTISLRAGGRERILEVVQTPRKRVGAAIAAEALIDHSPAPPERAVRPLDQAVRDPGAGRPTKRDRRRIDELRSGDPG